MVRVIEPSGGLRWRFDQAAVGRDKKTSVDIRVALVESVLEACNDQLEAVLVGVLRQDEALLTFTDFGSDTYALGEENRHLLIEILERVRTTTPLVKVRRVSDLSCLVPE